jgi:hypothetical protein
MTPDQTDSLLARYGGQSLQDATLRVILAALVCSVLGAGLIWLIH